MEFTVKTFDLSYILDKKNQCFYKLFFIIIILDTYNFDKKRITVLLYSNKK